MTTQHPTAALSALTVNSAPGSGAITLTPTFTPNIYAYAADIPEHWDYVYVGGNVPSSGMTVRINGRNVDRNTDGSLMERRVTTVGATTHIDIVVTSGDDARTYTVRLTKPAPAVLPTPVEPPRGIRVFVGRFRSDIDSVYRQVDAGLTPTGTRDISRAVKFETLNIEASEQVSGTNCTFSVREYIGTSPSILDTTPLGHGTEIQVFDTDARNPVPNRVGGKSVKLFGGILLDDKTQWHHGQYRMVDWVAVDYTWMLDARHARILLVNDGLIQGEPNSQTAGDMVVELLDHMYQITLDDNEEDLWYLRFLENTDRIFRGTVEETGTILTYDGTQQKPSEIIQAIAEEALYLWYVSVDAEIVFEPFALRDMSVGTRGLGVPRSSISDPEGLLVGRGFPSRAIVEGDVNTLGPDLESFFDLEEERTLRNTATKVLLGNIEVIQGGPRQVVQRVTESDHRVLSALNLQTFLPYRLLLEGNPLRPGNVSQVGLYRPIAGTEDDPTTLVPRVDYTLPGKLEYHIGALPLEVRPGVAAIAIGASSPASALQNTFVYFPTQDVQVGDYLFVEYISYETDFTIQRASDQTRADFARRTGGGGIREFLYSRLDGLFFVDPMVKQNLIRTIIDRKARLQVTGKFMTHQKGWLPGDLFLRFVREQGVRVDVEGNEVPDRPPETMYVISTLTRLESPVESGSGEARLLTEVEYANTRRGFDA